MSASSRRFAGASAAAALVVGGALLPLAAAPASASTFVAATIPITSPTRPDPTPVAVAVDMATAQAYVTNTFDGTVSVIDTRTNRVIDTVPNGPTSIGAGPSGAAIDPAHHQVYVTNYNSHTVSVIDTGTNRVTSVIPHDSLHGIGSGPEGVAVDPDLNRAFVSSVIDGTVSVIDTTVNQVIAVIPYSPTSGIGKFPLGVAIDTLLHRAYVANYNDDTVSVIDTRANSVIKVIPAGATNGIGDAPRKIAVDEISHRAFVTNQTAGTLSVIDTQTNAVTTVIPHDLATGIGDGPDGVVVDPVGRQVYVPTEARFTVIDADSLSVTKVITKSGSDNYGYGLQAIAVDPVRRHAYLTGGSSNSVAVLNLDSTAALSRRGGADRFEVSAANSAAEFVPGVDVAYVASGGAFADALSGSAAAGAHRAPVLLVGTDSIPTVIGGELARLKPKRIVVLGGAASVSTGVERALGGYSPIVDRLGGADRYAVSAAISKDGFSPGVPVAYIASGAVFPDALSGSAIAAKDGAPVLLVTKDTIPAAVTDELTRLNPGRIVVLGGQNTISTDVENTLRAAHPTTRIAGADRFGVSAAASAAGFPTGAKTVFIASGLVFPDALSGSPAAAANAAPVLLVGPNDIPTAVATELDRLNPSQIVVLGGTNTISDAVYQQLRSHLG
ncbi:cell wall-binding repeat-containing protein [Herbiconiux sp. P17]|uniref:cell wall-binding repeat-containing protein n=1 Tax=Herbiconiux wuyangfengii TaxID=3342794 RepID=UPI0035BA3D2D